MMIDSFVQVHSKYPEYKLRIYGTGLIETEIKDYIKKKQADKYIVMEGFASKVHESILDCAGFLSSSEDVLKKLLASGVSADEILEKLK